MLVDHVRTATQNKATHYLRTRCCIARNNTKHTQTLHAQKTNEGRTLTAYRIAQLATFPKEGIDFRPRLCQALPYSSRIFVDHCPTRAGYLWQVISITYIFTFLYTWHLFQSNTETQKSCFLGADLSTEFFRCVWNSEVLSIKKITCAHKWRGDTSSWIAVMLSWAPDTARVQKRVVAPLGSTFTCYWQNVLDDPESFVVHSWLRK